MEEYKIVRVFSDFVSFSQGEEATQENLYDAVGVILWGDVVRYDVVPCVNCGVVCVMCCV